MSIAAYADGVQALRGTYLDQPAVVSIETFAQCNAACGFCPYPDLTRKGARLDDEIVYRLLDEIAAFPQALPIRINFSRVNEPFLDARIFDFCHYAERAIPHASLVFFTNGTPLNVRNISRLAELSRVAYLNVSFNDHRAAEYERVMQLPFAPTLAVLNRLHAAVSDGRLAFPITLSRVGDGTSADDEFIEWCANSYPLFEAHSDPRGDWMGARPNAEPADVPDVGCSQWMKLHVLADGREAFCCIDAEGQFGHGSVHEKTLLEIYNAPSRRALRTAMLSRRSVEACLKCPLLS